MSSVDYLDIESAKAIDMYQQIAQNTMWSGYGVSITIKYFTEALNSLFRILGGVGLSVTLFLKAVPEDAGALVFLNSPFMSVIIPAVLLGSAILSSFLMGRSEKHGRIMLPVPVSVTGYSVSSVFWYLKISVPWIREFISSRKICAILIWRDATASAWRL